MKTLIPVVGMLSMGQVALSATVSVSTLRSGDLVVTEIMQNPAAVNDEYGEWFEVYNPTANTIDLYGLYVRDSGTSFRVGTHVTVAPGGYIVFGRNSTSKNGGVSLGYKYPAAFWLGNETDSITLYTSSATLDSVTWDDGATFPDPNGASMTLDPELLNAVSNDLGTSWYEGSSRYGLGDRGTPGRANDPYGLAYGVSTLVGGEPSGGNFNLTSGDVDEDGYPDIALAHGIADAGLLLNQGDGSFEEEERFSEDWWDIEDDDGATSTTLADLDGDGLLDYVVALYGNCYVEKMIQLYQGDGYGQRMLPRGIPNGLVCELNGTNPMQTRVADFDHNGLPDIASGSNNGAHSVDIILQTAAWNFVPTYSYNQNWSSNPQWIDVGDFNRDGWMDLVVPFLYDQVEIYLNTANGTGAMVYAGGYLSSHHHQVAVADFDGNGFVDVAARSTGEEHVDILFNDGTGHFPTSQTLEVSGTGEALRAGDLNGDGKADLVVCSDGASSLDILVNEGLGSFTRIPFALEEPAFMVTLDDFDQDGDLDIAAFTSTFNVTDHVQVLWNMDNW